MKVFVAGVVVGILMLQGCSESATFAKPNVSASVAQRDADQCWQQAQKKKFPDDKAFENATLALVVAGVVGVGVNYAMNEDAYRARLRDECMAKRGYAKPKSS